MSLRDALRKAAGLLVELPSEEAPLSGPEPDAVAGSTIPAPPAAGGSAVDRLLADLEREAAGRAPTKSVEQILRESQGPSLQEIHVDSAAVPASPNLEGAVDFVAIYRSAGLPEVGFGAEQMLEMLGSLPPELPLETKRQTVKVSLNALGKAVGATAENLVADASRKLAALTAYVESVEKQTQEQATSTETEIATLQQQIVLLQEKLAQQRQILFHATRACEAEAGRLDDILEFFSLDVPPSTLAPTPSPTG